MTTEISHADHSQKINSTGLPGQVKRKLNILMLGAGSFFTGSVLKDVILIPEVLGGELRLVDIDPDRLELTRKMVQKIVDEVGGNADWKVIADVDRRKLMPGVDYIVNAIEVSGASCVGFDNDIPLKYGVSQNIGDTIGPGGLFKGLRTLPVWIDFLQDAEKYCPTAQVLNYTNPMNMMCLAAARTSRMKHVGLCHSVQGTSRLLAEAASISYEDMKWECAGINHLAWFTKLEGPNGENLYDKLVPLGVDRESDFAKKEPVRTDMMVHFGAFITESSGHLSEYVPYYRKRKDLLDRYTGPAYTGEEGFYAKNWPNWRRGQDEARLKIISGETPIEAKRTFEYGAWIIEAIEKDVPFVIHGNVANNDGLIQNLPADGCVEVACLVDRNGIQPTKFGKLPKAMAAVCDSNMRMFDLAVDAAITKSKTTAKQALLLDPLTSAVCSPAEIFEMVDEIFEAESDYLPGYK